MHSLLLLAALGSALAASSPLQLQRQLDAAEARVHAAEAEAAELRAKLRRLPQEPQPTTTEPQPTTTTLAPPGPAAATAASRRPTSNVTGQPVAFWASQPVKPAETLLLGVTFMGSGTQIELRQLPGDWTVARPVNGSVTAYGCAVTVPTGFAYAPFEVRAGGSAGAALAVNRPSPWFAFGDAGERATPGGWVRIVGEAIGLDKPSTLVLRAASGGAAHTLAARSSPGGIGAAPTRWHAFFDLPRGIALGSYELSLRGGAGAVEEKLCMFLSVYTTCLSTINVTKPKQWPSKVFTVASRQPGIGRNATAGVLAALRAARANGGGVVLFPRGQYFIDVPLIVPDKTVIRGAGKDLVAIYFKEATCPCDLVEMARLYSENQTKWGRNLTACRAGCTAPLAYVTSDKACTAAPGAACKGAARHPSWGIEGLSLYVTAYAKNIVQFQPGSDGCHMRDVRIRFNSQLCHNPGDHGKPGRGNRTANWPIGGGQAVTLAGRNLFVTDNDIYSSGDVVGTRGNGDDIGGAYMHIARNRMWNGGTTHYGISWKQSIFEDNVATGVSPTAMGSNYPQYGHSHGDPSVQNIYHHNNSQSQVWGNDREMMTCDGGGGAFFGHIMPLTPTSVRTAHAARGIQPGGAICVLEGTNTGACRRVISGLSATTVCNKTQKAHFLCPERHFTFDTPFPSPLDGTSLVSIMPFVGHMAFNGNDYSDGGEVQFYATALGIVAAENKFTRTGGLSAWAREDEGLVWNPNLRVSFVDNEVVEGNHIWNYNLNWVPPKPRVPPVPADTRSITSYHPGGSKALEPWSFGSLTNEQGFPVDWSPNGSCTTDPCFYGAMNRFIVFRGNKVRSNGGVVIRGTSANVVVELNTIELSDVGVYVNHTTTTGGVVVRNNTEPPAVAGKNYNPYTPAKPKHLRDNSSAAQVPLKSDEAPSLKTDDDTSSMILWASQPTLANQTALLFGSGLSSTTAVQISEISRAGQVVATVSAPAFDVSATSLKVTLPPELQDGALQLCAVGAAGAAGKSPCVTINAPDTWWLRGDLNLTHASPGGWIRVFGRLGDEGGRLPVPTLLVGNLELQRHNGSGNDALYFVPSSAPSGKHMLQLRFGGVARAVASPYDTITVAAKPRWPGARSVVHVNTTDQLWSALIATRLAGGGTILIARGTYVFTTETVDLPPFTTLRGASTAHTHLFWRTSSVNISAVPKYFIGGNATFAVEDLTISCDRFYHNIIADGNRRVTDPWVNCTKRKEDLPNCGESPASSPPVYEHSRGVRIRRVRIRADCFTRLVERGNSRRGFPAVNFTYEQIGAGISLNGQDYEVSDCDIYSSGHGIWLGHTQQSLWASASVGIVARNIINFGSDCYQIDSSSNVIFERNECVGTNLFSRGSAAGSTYGGPAATDIFFASNSIRFLFGGDGEELTLDGGTSPLNGRGIKVNGNNVTFPHAPVYNQWCSPPWNCRDIGVNWTGSAMYVLGGQGAGQMRVFEGGGLADGYNRTWKLEQPFGGTGGGVSIDEQSFVSVFERREHMIIRDNLFSDGGPMQLYGGMRHAQINNNTAVRTAGYFVEGLNHQKPGMLPTLMPCYFIEHSKNKVLDRRLQAATAGFFTSGFYNTSLDFHGPMAVGIVYRDNHIDDGAWRIQGAVADVLLEGNAMENSRQCGTVGPGCKGGACGPCDGGCCEGLQVANGKQPDGATNVTTVFRVFLRNNRGLCHDLAKHKAPPDSVTGC